MSSGRGRNLFTFPMENSPLGQILAEYKRTDIEYGTRLLEQEHQSQNETPQEKTRYLAARVPYSCGVTDDMMLRVKHSVVKERESHGMRRTNTNDRRGSPCPCIA